MSLRISEIFGPTVQGEGPHVGRHAGFIRLGLCNLSCHWCDAAYTWDWSRYDRKVELTTMATEQIVAAVDALGVRRVVITGGEPLVQVTGLVELCQALRPGGYAIEIETNGTFEPPDALTAVVDQWNVSPKLAHAEAGPLAVRIRPDVLGKYETLGADFKFVVTSPADLDEVADILREADIPGDRVWIMAEGVSSEAVHDHERQVIAGVLERGWNLTPRLHIDLWGADRGH